MGASGPQGMGKGDLVTLPPSLVSFSRGTELAVLRWVPLDRPRPTGAQEAPLFHSISFHLSTYSPRWFT